MYKGVRQEHTRIICTNLLERRYLNKHLVSMCRIPVTELLYSQNYSHKRGRVSTARFIKCHSGARCSYKARLQMNATNATR